jgi:pimeloyl-ACP methyl ester carboxylesterase
MRVASQFVEVDARRVMLRYAGRGPAVLLLHQSPQNSRALIPWIERLAARYSVLAPDTPGFGDSDPLPVAQPTIPDFAAALSALLDRLGIEKVLLYGVHTGAVTALRFALDFPSRVAGVVCDGYARFNATERSQLLNGYLPPFEPEWSGGHLTWLWARMREQNLFFPWNTPIASSRILYPAPSAAKLHMEVMDILDAGDGYRAGYRAPFLYDDASAASRLRVPTRIFYRAEDVLAAHLPRLGALPPQVEVAKLEGGAVELADKSDAFFAQYAVGASVIDVEEKVVRAVSARRRVIATPYGELVVLLSANGGSFTDGAHVVLGDIGVAARVPVDAPHGTAVVSVMWPGHGASRGWSAQQVSVAQVAEAVGIALNTLGVRTFSISGEGGGAAFALALARLTPSRCTGVTLVNPLPLNAAETDTFLRGLPDLTPHDTGAHLLAAWNWARMSALFWPWLSQTAQNARKVDAPAPMRLHQDVREILRAGELFAPLWRAALSINLTDAVEECTVPLRLRCEDMPARVALVARLIAARDFNEHSKMHSGERVWAS